MKHAKPKPPKVELDCLECSGSLHIVRKNYRFSESGLDNVILKDFEVLVCDQCKAETPRLPRLNDLMRTIAIAIITKPYGLEGQDVRFLRKYLGLSNEAFATIINVDKSHLSRVENGATPVSACADRLVRLIALGLSEGLEPKARNVITRFSQIKKLRKFRLIVDVKRWTVQYDLA